MIAIFPQTCSPALRPPCQGSRLVAPLLYGTLQWVQGTAAHRAWLCVSFLAWEQPVHYVLLGRVPRYRSRPRDAARAPVREARSGTLDGTLLVLGSLALLVPRVDLAVDVRDVAPLDEVARLAPGVMDSSG